MNMNRVLPKNGYLLDRVLDFPNIVDLESDADQNNRLFNFLR